MRMQAVTAGDELEYRLQQIDRMNTELLKDDSLKLFLWKINTAVLRAGKPVPRSLLTRVPEITKARLQKLVKAGYLKEHRVKEHKPRKGQHPFDTRMSELSGLVLHTEYVGYTLGDKITFKGGKLAYVVQEDVEPNPIDAALLAAVARRARKEGEPNARDSAAE